jgi:phage/plasmid-like protein (TIGR03299 family)
MTDQKQLVKGIENIMAHNIEQNDKGIVGFSEIYGGTWHNLEQYKVVEGACDPDYIRNFINYEVIKEQAQRAQRIQKISNPDGSFSELVIPAEYIPENYLLVRKDNDKILCPNVGERYEILDNTIVFDWMMENIVRPNNLEIESAGTLKGGQLCFFNLTLGKFAVKGDNSETISKLMYYNSYGKLAVATGAHSTRIVCNNTLTLAECQAAANGTLKKLNHTKNVKSALQKAIVDLSGTLLGVKQHHETLNILASQKMTADDVSKFLDMFIPIPKQDNAPLAGITGALNNRELLLNTFDTCENLKGDIWHTRYSMLQAVTDVEDHSEKGKRKTADAGSTWFDGLYGTKAKHKAEAFEILTKKMPNPALLLTA